MKFNIEFDGRNAVSVTAFGDKPYVADSNHPNFKNIINGLQTGYEAREQGGKPISDEQIVRLFDTSLALTDTFVSLSDRVTQNGGHIFFDGVELVGSLIDRILAFLRDGLDFGPLVLFLENLGNNPSDNSRKSLYDFLENHRFSITTDGYFVAYKGVKANWLSGTSGKAIVDGKQVVGQIPNKPGSTVIMPRNEVLDNPGTACASGLHAATYDFAQSWASGGHMLMVKINPRDVVSVPRDGGGAKMRVCRYTVVKEVTTEDKRDLIDLGDVKRTAEFGPDKAPPVVKGASVAKAGEGGSVAEQVREAASAAPVEAGIAALAATHATKRQSVKANKTSKAKKVAKSKAKTKDEVDVLAKYKTWKREDFDKWSLKDFRFIAKDFGVPNSAKITAAARKAHTDRFVRRMRDHRRARN